MFGLTTLKGRLSSILILFVTLVTMSGCVSKERLVLFQDSDDYLDAKRIASTFDIRIQADDQLAISISSEFKELVDVFNNKTFIGSGAGMGNSGYGGGMSSGSGSNNMSNLNGFHVDKDGYIEFPIFGKIRVEGLTRQQAADVIQTKLREKYVKDAVVSVELLSFHVVVMGGGQGEQILNINKDRFTLLEALTMAGGFKYGAFRDNVLVIREENGEVWTYRVDVTRLSDLLNSPVYYLQQNDIVYIEPGGAASVEESPAQKYIASISSILGFVTSITALIISFAK